MAGRGVSAPADWFERECAGAPAALRERAARFLALHPATEDLAEDLARAAAAALAAALERPNDRAAALDLLAADALVTLALKARAAERPEGLAAFASGLGGSAASGQRPDD